VPDRELENQVIEEEEKTLKELVTELLGNTEFVLFMLTITGVYYVVGGLLYWSSNYMITVLSVSKSVATTTVAITCITAPIAGVFVGALVASFHGGSSTPKAQVIAVVFGWVGVACALPVPLVSSVYYFAFFCWLCLFFGGFILPTMLGMMLNTVPNKMKGSANSIAQFSYNFLGFMPSPFVYGLLAEITNDGNKQHSSIPLAVTVYMGFVAIIIGTIGVYKLQKRRKARHAKHLKHAEDNRVPHSPANTQGEAALNLSL